jgi:hypothetical protein
MVLTITKKNHLPSCHGLLRKMNFLVSYRLDTGTVWVM